jgi:hypothetical protein
VDSLVCHCVSGVLENVTRQNREHWQAVLAPTLWAEGAGRTVGISRIDRSKGDVGGAG